MRTEVNVKAETFAAPWDGLLNRPLCPAVADQDSNSLLQGNSAEPQASTLPVGPNALRNDKRYIRWSAHKYNICVTVLFVCSIRWTVPILIASSLSLIWMLHPICFSYELSLGMIKLKFKSRRIESVGESSPWKKGKTMGHHSHCTLVTKSTRLNNWMLLIRKRCEWVFFL